MTENDEQAVFEEEDDPAWALDDPCPNPQCPEVGMWVTRNDRGYDTIRCGGCGETYPG